VSVNLISVRNDSEAEGQACLTLPTVLLRVLKLEEIENMKTREKSVLLRIALRISHVHQFSFSLTFAFISCLFQCVR